MDVNVAISIPKPVNVALETLASNPVPPSPLPFEKPLVFDPAIRKHWFTMPFNGTFRTPTNLVNVTNVTVKANGVNKSDGNPINAGQQVLVEITATNPALQASLQFNAEFLLTQLPQETLQWQEVPWINHYGAADAGEIYKGHPFALQNSGSGPPWGHKAQGAFQVTGAFEMEVQIGTLSMFSLHSALIADGTATIYTFADYTLYRFNNNTRVYKGGVVAATVADNTFLPIKVISNGSTIEFRLNDGTLIYSDPTFNAGQNYYLYPFFNPGYNDSQFFFARVKGNIIAL